MGFFSDLKEDLSQAVNELMPGDDTEKVVADEAAQTEGTVEYEAVTGESEEVTTEDTAEAVDENTDDMLSLDEMLKNIDSIQLPESEEDSEDVPATEDEAVVEEASALEEVVAEEEDILDVAAVMESAIAIA